MSADTSAAEREYHVDQLLNEMRACGFDLRKYAAELVDLRSRLGQQPARAVEFLETHTGEEP